MNYFAVSLVVGSELAAAQSIAGMVVAEDTPTSPVVVSEPLMSYGLGVLEAANYSASLEVPVISTVGGIGAVLWDISTGEQSRILRAPEHYALSAAISPDGTMVITGGNDGTARLWNMSTGAEARVFGPIDGEAGSNSRATHAPLARGARRLRRRVREGGRVAASPLVHASTRPRCPQRLSRRSPPM